MAEENQIIVPFLKWAGGKRWLVKNYLDLFPKSFNRYIEPFLGSGAVFFSLRPKFAILSDINIELITVYRAIKARPDLVHRYLKTHHLQHSKEYYYKIRSSRPNSEFAQAARTIYLNRTCWNALYRVNKEGVFNVPMGTKINVSLQCDDFYAVSGLLHGAIIIADDFERIISRAKRGDFVFLDPPYTVKHKYNGFIKYNEKLFSWADQIRLRHAVDNAACRGVKLLVTNADHYSTRKLYADFSMHTLTRPSVIAGNSQARGRCSELLIKCW